MARFLKQSTEVTVPIGPFLDATDAVTEETGLASNGTEIRKAGASFATGPTLGTHDAEGYYPVTLTTSHTDTLGPLRIKSHDSATHLPVWEDFIVVPANVYDSLVGGSDTLQADVTQWLGTAAATPSVAGVPEVDLTHINGAAQTATLDDIEAQTDDIGVAGAGLTALPAVDVGSISGSATAAATLEAQMDAYEEGTAQAGAAGSITLRSGASASNDYYNGAVVWITGGTGAGQFRVIDDYVGSTKVASISPNWVTNPDATSVYAIAGAPSSTASPPDVNVTQIAGTSQTANDVGADVDTMLSRLIGTIATGTHNPQSGDAYARIGANGAGLTDLATASALATVDTNVDTLLTRITSSLFNGITSMAEWLGMIAGKQTPDATAQTEIRATGGGSGTYDATADSQEAIRDRGDAAWVTGAGGSSPTASEIADAVWDEATSGHTTAGTFGKAVADILEDTGTSIPALINALNDPSAAAIADAIWDEAQADHTTAGSFGEVASEIAAILVDTDTTIPGLINALNDVSAADVNAQLVDVLSTDTQTLPGQGAPTATPTLTVALMYLYKAWRNKSDQTASTYQLYADDGTTVDQKRTVSDDGTTFDAGEIETGP